MFSSTRIAWLLVVLLISLLFLSSKGIGAVTSDAYATQDQKNNQLRFDADLKGNDSWLNPPVSTYLQFWLWECVNGQDVASAGVTPMFVQRGPFTYLEHRNKTGIRFNDNSTVTYRQQISYTFLRNMSSDDETMAVTMINVPVVTMLNVVSKLSGVLQDMFNVFAKQFNETLFVTHTVHEWIWGYEDLLLKAVKNSQMNESLVLDDHFGFFYGRNGSDDGLYTVFTDQSDIDQFNVINKWNGESFLTYWKTRPCNQINGTDGSWFPPLINDDLSSTRLYMYFPDICRSVYATFENHSSILNVPTETFSIPAEVFLNATLNPDNIGFGDNDSGILDISVCKKGAPIVLSLPHFLYAADQYKAQIYGMAPDPSVHRTVLYVEPRSGLVLSAQKRFQMNILVKPDLYFFDLQRLPKPIIMPAIWINESTIIDQKAADDLFGNLTTSSVTTEVTTLISSELSTSSPAITGSASTQSSSVAGLNARNSIVCSALSLMLLRTIIIHHKNH